MNHTKQIAGIITALDVQMGRLRKELRDLGVAENTMLWFTSDNGPEGDTGDKGTTRGSAGPFRGRKRSLAGKDCSVPFTPDKDDVHPSERGAAVRKRSADSGGRIGRPFLERMNYP